MRIPRRLRSERGSAVVEFPLIAALIVLIGLATIQAAIIVHVRNTLVDAAVQGAHHAALLGNDTDDGADRAALLVRERFGDAYEVRTDAVQDASGRITVRVVATMPLVGLLGPSGTLEVDGHAVSEEAL
ncbi:TadE/TadG family type IV pilus assembly protein [Brachybacterium nesterenkovii]|uniref:Putative membrane protein n=1 Tax=Brachybacterium nesterenkovii TaxID=47847 RepID=A0A1X6WYC5_9MICO|nr:TadE family protein [Brachybacterium nesterenkovii]SLM90953.1 putative membrane protein [Brachybacterium nesterenkovii]